MSVFTLRMSINGVLGTVKLSLCNQEIITTLFIGSTFRSNLVTKRRLMKKVEL